MTMVNEEERCLSSRSIYILMYLSFYGKSISDKLFKKNRYNKNDLKGRNILIKNNLLIINDSD